MDIPLSLTQPASTGDTKKHRSIGDYEVLKEIGDGSFSIVYQAREKLEPHRDVAIKMCIKKQIIRDRRVKYVHREKEALALLSTQQNQHPAIVSLYATFQDADNLFFVLSYAKWGDLLHIMFKQEGKRFNLKHSRYYSAVLLSALDHIHSLGILHRDVKPENILVKHDGRIMLSDFGSSTFLKEHEKEFEDRAKETEIPAENGRSRRVSFVGTAQYVPPEMLTSSKLSPASDLWSFAVVLFQFLTGQHAFHDESEYLIFKRVQDALYKFPTEFEANAKDLIEKLIVIKPESRISAEHVINHPFFAEIDFSTLNDIEPPQIYT